MPIITVDTTPLTREQKNRIISEYTRIACEVTGLPPSAMIVIINEVKADDVGVGGVQLSDMHH